MTRVYITNLGKYNEGKLVGEWVELPVSEIELTEVFKRIGISDEPDNNGNYYEEYFITDFETDMPFEIGEYENIDSLNENVEAWEMLSDYEKDIATAYVIYNGASCDLEEAIEHCNDGSIYYKCYNEEDVAMEYVEECGILSNVPDILKNYFDYKAYGRDLFNEGKFVEIEFGKYVEIY